VQLSAHVLIQATTQVIVAFIALSLPHSNRRELSWSSSLLLWGVFDDSHGDCLSMVSLLLLLGGLEVSSLLLLCELLFSDLLVLHLVDSLDKNGFVLELVTLGGEVEVMVDILGDLLGLSILLEQSSEDSLSSHPLDLDGHSSASGSLSLTGAGVSSLSLGLVHSLASRSRVHLHLSLHDNSILMELSDVLSC